MTQKEGSFINFKGLGESRRIFCQQMAALAISVAVYRGETVLEKAWFQSFVGHCESDDFVFFAQGLSSVFHHLVNDKRDPSKKIEYLNNSWEFFLKEYVKKRHLGVPIKIERSELRYLDKLVQSIQDDISDDLKAELDARM